jgi:hypothetical protein
MRGLKALRTRPSGDVAVMHSDPDLIGGSRAAASYRF